jgi:hypothetical protein
VAICIKVQSCGREANFWTPVPLVAQLVTGLNVSQFGALACDASSWLLPAIASVCVSLNAWPLYEAIFQIPDRL